jgi:hypothetical protein
LLGASSHIVERPVLTLTSQGDIMDKKDETPAEELARNAKETVDPPFDRLKGTTRNGTVNTQKIMEDTKKIMDASRSKKK